MSNMVELCIVGYLDGSDRVNNNKIISKILNIIMNILIFIFGIVLLISIYNIIQVNVLGNEKSSFFGYSLFEVQSGSMSPAIEKGDWIIVKYSKKIELKDIITFKDGDNYITHRVLEKYNQTYVTMGDANNTKDDPITQEQIVGKVVKILPAFGIFRATIFNPFVLIALIVTIYIVNLTFKKNMNGSDSMKKIDIILKDICDKVLVIIKKLIKLIKEKINNIKENKQKQVESQKEEKKPILQNVKEKITSNDNEEEQVSKIVSEINENPPELNEDFDKTLYFRMVKVDKEDINNLNKVEEYDEEVEIEDNKYDEDEVEEEVSESVIVKNLEILHQKRKKFKDIIDKAMFMKEQELGEIIDVLNEEESLKTNEATIRELLIEAYIDAKYYNFCGDVNVEYDGRNVNTLVTSAIKESANELIKEYKGSDNKFKEKVNKYSNILQLICYLEHSYTNMSTVADKRKFYKNKILKTMTNITFSAESLSIMVNKILKIQNKYRGMLKYTIDKMDTNMFILKYNSVSKKNVYGLELEHNVAFSKVYSEYIIDKTYSDGIIAEDKLEVLINLLLVGLVKDMTNGVFNKKYILYIPESLYEKVNKLIKIFKLLEDEYAKSNVIILVRYEKLSENKKNIIKLMKAGYKFAVDLDEDITLLREPIVQMMEYIFVNKDGIKDKKLNISSELEDKVIVDNIGSKIGSYWGE